MRCFIALPLPLEVKDSLAFMSSFLRARWPALRWTACEGYHITLAFLGEIEEPAITCARRALTAVAAEPRLGFSFAGLGVFPEPGRAAEAPWRVLYVRGQEREAGSGARVHRRVNEVLEREARLASIRALNAEWPGGKPFTAHITLARAAKTPPRAMRPAPPPSLAELAAAARLPAGEWTIDRCVLYKSELRRGGSVYEEIESVAFSGGD